MDRTQILTLTKSRGPIFVICLLFLSCSGSGAVPSFDGARAYFFLQKQCELGPRVPNSLAHALCLDYLYQTLLANTSRCRIEHFAYYDPVTAETLRLANIIASFDGSGDQRVLLGAHWDCRPWADRDPDSSRHNEGVLGANDAASGVAVLLTVAEVLKVHRPYWDVDIVLFDGEDLGSENNPDGWALGSKQFVRNMGRPQPMAVIVLDMIGDRDLAIFPEYYSQRYSGWLVGRFWKAAAMEKATSFKSQTRSAVYDDHVPFIEAGIPAIVVADYDYPAWHTTSDTPDKCAEESLAEVGRVVLRALYDKKILARKR